MLATLCMATLCQALPPQPTALASLLKFVPNDAAITLIVQDGRGHINRLQQSPFAKQLSNDPDWKQFGADKLNAAIITLNAVLKAQVNITSQQLLDDILGDAVVFAFYPENARDKIDEYGVLYIRPRNPALLTEMLQTLDANNPPEIRPHANGSITARRLFDQRAIFSASRAEITAFSANQAAVERFLAAPESDELLTQVRKSGATNTLLTLLFRGRAFDGEIANQIQLALNENDRIFLTQFQSIWKAVDTVALTIRIENSLQLAATATYRENEIPGPIRQLKTLTSTAPLAIPPDAILAARFQLDIPAILAALVLFQTESQQAELRSWLSNSIGPAVGRDQFNNVLAGIGPNYAVTVLPPKDGWIPAGHAAVQLSNVAIHEPVQSAVDLVLQFIRFEYNSEHENQLKLIEHRTKTSTCKSFTGPGLEPGQQPTAGIVSGYFVLTHHPDAIEAFAVAKTVQSAPLIQIRCQSLARYVTTHRQQIVSYFSKTDEKPVAVVEQEMEDLLRLMRKLQTIEIVHNTQPGVTQLVLSVEFIASLSP